MSDHTQKKTSNTLRPPYDWPLGPSHPLILLLAHVVPAMPASLLFLLPLVGILGSLTLVDRLEDYYSGGLVQETNRHGFDPWVGKIPWRRAWQPTPILLPGESHGQRSWWATVHGVTKRVGHNSGTKQQQNTKTAEKWLLYSSLQLTITKRRMVFV